MQGAQDWGAGKGPWGGGTLQHLLAVAEVLPSVLSAVDTAGEERAGRTQAAAPTCTRGRV